MDREQVTRHLGRLYGESEHFELVAVKSGQAKRKTFRWPDDGEEVVQAIKVFEEKDWNIYASVLPLERQEEKRYDRVWIDRDELNAPWPFGADPNWNYPAWPDPAVIVRTSQEAGGTRWQAVWMLDEPLSEKEGRELIRRLAERGYGDTSVHDPRRVLRVAGVRNAKRNDVARLLATSNGKTSPEQFMLPTLSDGNGMPTLEALQTGEITSPQMVLGEYLGGVQQGDRARKAYVTARFLKSCGVVFDDAIPILVTGGRRCNPPLSDDEILHAARSAYHK